MFIINNMIIKSEEPLKSYNDLLKTIPNNDDCVTIQPWDSGTTYSTMWRSISYWEVDIKDMSGVIYQHLQKMALRSVFDEWYIPEVPDKVIMSKYEVKWAEWLQVVSRDFLRFLFWAVYSSLPPEDTYDNPGTVGLENLLSKYDRLNWPRTYL